MLRGWRCVRSCSRWRWLTPALTLAWHAIHWRATRRATRRVGTQPRTLALRCISPTGRLRRGRTLGGAAASPLALATAMTTWHGVTVCGTLEGTTTSNATSIATRQAAASHGTTRAHRASCNRRMHGGLQLLLLLLPHGLRFCHAASHLRLAHFIIVRTGHLEPWQPAAQQCSASSEGRVKRLVQRWARPRVLMEGLGLSNVLGVEVRMLQCLGDGDALLRVQLQHLLQQIQRIRIQPGRRDS